RVPGRVRGLPEEFLEPSLQLLPEVGNVAVKEELHELVKEHPFMGKVTPERFAPERRWARAPGEIPKQTETVA
ncbi:unnamed protein product, partial [Durusdinium trenchii]